MINDVMSKKIISVDPSEKASNAAKKMKDNRVGSLLVVQKNKLVGMVTDRKIATGVVAAGLDPNMTPVSKFMIKGPVSVRPDQQECDATKIMGEHKYRRLPVVEKTGDVVGVVSISDLTKHARSCTNCNHNILKELSR